MSHRWQTWGVSLLPIITEVLKAMGRAKSDAHLKHMIPSQRVFTTAACCCLGRAKEGGKTSFLGICPSQCPLPTYAPCTREWRAAQSQKVSALEFQIPLKNWANKPPHKESYDDDDHKSTTKCFQLSVTISDSNTFTTQSTMLHTVS
jgi:hypothetical protein